MKLAKGLTLAVTLVVAAGCAKFPNFAGGLHTRLIFTMTVAGHIRNGPTEVANYVYLVAVNPSTDLFPTAQGPIPVVAPPWGNGFVAGNATHFVRYDYTQSSPYLVYKFATPDLLQYGATGVPVVYQVPGQNGATIQFEVDMSQIAPTGVDPDTLNSVQVNFLTMNRIPQGSDTGQKYWDALGDGHDPNSVNDYVRIPLTSSRVFTNADFQDLEPQGDVPDPDLDIVNWSVEVRKP